jgi:hypothetical protein
LGEFEGKEEFRGLEVSASSRDDTERAKLETCDFNFQMRKQSNKTAQTRTMSRAVIPAVKASLPHQGYAACVSALINGGVGG